ncbi:MAG: FlgO family outer membrane protein [Candidatus Udaeobacter sp.]
MAQVAASKSTTCARCGAALDTASLADLGCMVCMLHLGFEKKRAFTDREPSLDQFGQYVIEKREDGRAWELGRGAMGVTYRAIDTSLQRAVALKLIKADFEGRGSDTRERFMREARAAGALRHPNVATVYQSGIDEESGQCFYAMELVEGETLEERVRRIGPLDVPSAIEIARQIAAALAAAEKRGLVHRDLKPANVMIATGEESDKVAIKVIDFGLAKALAETPDMRALTRGSFIGTPAFASPEQFTDAPVDVRSDIYSLGATLWYLLTGHMPFGDRVGKGSDEPPAVVRPPIEQLKTAGVPPRFSSLLVAMLAIEPAARPGVNELSTKLEAMQKPNRAARLLGIAAVLALAMLVAYFSAPFHLSPKSSVAASEKSIAVLPFENLSSDKENAFFTDGIQDEILTDLAKIAELKVISRTSVMQYGSSATRNNLREIAQALNVAYVVEGSVQRSANRVRVSAQLINARNDTHVWGEKYDRNLTDVFAIQSEIAKAIADQLQAKLSPNEKKAIEQPPTTDLAAFDLYSRAKSLFLTTGLSATSDADLRKAIELLDEAVKRDPSFFDAYCQLAWAHEQLYAVNGSDHTPARLALAEAAVQAATRLRPDAAETHLARANYLYFGLRDYAGALAELEITQRSLPNDPRLFELTGYILKRRRGQQEEGLKNLQRAVELDPRNFGILQQFAVSYLYIGRYADAIAALDRVLAIVPDNVETRANRGEWYVCWKADTRPLHQTIDAILAQGPGAIANAADLWFFCALAERDPAAAERALVALGDNYCWTENPLFLSRSFGEGLLARMTKDEARARTAFEAARSQQEKIVQADLDYGPTLCVLGLIDAALGRKDLALDEGRRAIALMPVEKDVLNGSLVLQYFAITAAWAGEKELALQQLEAGLRAPTASLMVSYGALKLHPFWDPLRGDPRFEKIVASLAPKETK